MSMAAKLSDLAEEMSGASLQMDGQTEEPTQGAKDLWESEEDDSSPSHSLLWSPAWRLPSSHPNMKYCLEIQVTLTEELGAIPPPSHSWMAPLVEDMLQEARTGLTKAVVIGPGRAILFYGRCSLGEGLKVDKARHAAFLLTGAGMWAGKSAYFTTDPMTIPEGKRAIAQAVSDHRVKARGLEHPCVNLLAQQPFQFNGQRVSPQKMCLETAVLTIPECPIGPPEAENATGDEETKGLNHPDFLHLHWTVGLSDRSSLSTTSSMSSRSDRSDRSRLSR